MQDGDQVAVADNRDPFNLFGGGGVHALEPCAVGRRPEDLRIQHARQADVPGVLGLAGDLVQGVPAQDLFADHLEFGRALQGGFLFHVPGDRLSLGQRRIGDRSSVCRSCRTSRRLPPRVCPEAPGAAQPPAPARTALASAPAARKGGPKKRVLMEPKVPMSHGHSEVSPITMSTDSRLTSSSSASIWASDVMIPWPISILPVKQVTRPSAPILR